jgi:hypothetical protein
VYLRARVSRCSDDEKTRAHTNTHASKHKKHTRTNTHTSTLVTIGRLTGRHPAPLTPNPKSQTRNPKPETQNPKPFAGLPDAIVYTRVQTLKKQKLALKDQIARLERLLKESS